MPGPCLHPRRTFTSPILAHCLEPSPLCILCGVLSGMDTTCFPALLSAALSGWKAFRCPAQVTPPYPLGRILLGHVFSWAHVPTLATLPEALASMVLLICTGGFSRPGESGVQVLRGQFSAPSELMPSTVPTQPVQPSLSLIHIWIEGPLCVRSGSGHWATAITKQHESCPKGCSIH